MSYVLLALFVYGIHKVIWGFADFLGVDLDALYNHMSVDESDYRIRPNWQKFLFKPLFYCNVCMSSFWGTICYFLILDLRALDIWILHCVISTGLITIVNKLTER